MNRYGLTTLSLSLTIIISIMLMSEPKANAWGPYKIQQEGETVDVIESLMFQLQFDLGTNDYQIGDEWGKKVIAESELQNPVFKRAAYATARVGGATGFYLGNFAGYNVVATNNHVCKTDTACNGKPVNFELLHETYRVKETLGSWPEIDLALLVVEGTTKDQESKLLPFAGPFAFSNEIAAGTPLLTIGYGFANNFARKLVANQDADCVVFSKKNEFHFMKDPDEVNPGNHETWSFSNGCDVSHGDSGSAMVDRNTGEVLGIIWTGRVPKNERIRSSAYLKTINGTDSPDVWTELSYSVPAPKIHDRLLEISRGGGFTGDKAVIIEAILNHK